MSGASNSSSSRRDAARNRQSLLAAAAAVFERDGLNAPLESVAVAAGLSRASLARHYPSRDELIAALWEADIDRIERIAREVDQAPDALLTLFDTVIRWQIDRRAVRPSSGQLERGDLAGIIARLAAAVDATLVTSLGAGCARPGLTTNDVLLAIEMCAHVITEPETRTERQRRYSTARRLMLPGLLAPAWVAAHPEIIPA